MKIFKVKIEKKHSFLLGVEAFSKCSEMSIRQDLFHIFEILIRDRFPKSLSAHSTPLYGLGFNTVEGSCFAL